MMEIIYIYMTGMIDNDGIRNLINMTIAISVGIRFAFKYIITCVHLWKFGGSAGG